MPDLDAILDDTLLLRACRGLDAAITGLELYADLPAAPPAPALARFTRLSRAEVLYADAPDKVPVEPGSAVWSFWKDDDPSRVLDVTCKVPARDVPGVPAHELFVCTAVHWGPVTISPTDSPVALPVTREFLARAYLMPRRAEVT